jgi:hypothetical protein
VFTFGVIFMLLTDLQKYIVLGIKKGLISWNMMAWSRNMNYVGEIMLYSSFVIIH